MTTQTPVSAAPRPGQAFLAVVVEVPDLESMSAERFADWCIEGNTYPFFANHLKWAEGWLYCTRSWAFAARSLPTVKMLSARALGSSEAT